MQLKQLNVLYLKNYKISKLVKINKGVREVCLLSLTLFNVYLEEITKRKKQDLTGIELSKNQHLLTLLFADEQVITTDTEDNLQKAELKLNRLITECDLNICTENKI
jgi:hypothetical protein